jgi:hypothetical protein
MVTPVPRPPEESTCEVQTENPGEITPQCSQRQENGQAAEDGEENKPKRLSS